LLSQATHVASVQALLCNRPAPFSLRPPTWLPCKRSYATDRPPSLSGHPRGFRASAPMRQTGPLLSQATHVASVQALLCNRPAPFSLRPPTWLPCKRSYATDRPPSLSGHPRGFRASAP